MPQTHETRLRKEREKRGWARGYIAEQVGVDVATVGRWERGERLPYPHYRQKLCDLFAMDAYELGLHGDVNESIQLDEPVGTDDLGSEAERFEPTATFQSQKANASLSRQIGRREILIGLGGLSTAALALGTGGYVWASIRASAQVKRQRSPYQYRLDDPRVTSGWVNNLAWSPDGRSLASANGINTVTLWDIQQGSLTQTCSVADQWVNDVAWSRTNYIAAACSGLTHGTVLVWQPPEIQSIFTYHGEPIRTVAWSPDGIFLAWAGHSSTVEIWNIHTQRFIRAYQDGKDGGINRIKWSPDGRYLAAATDSGRVSVWEAASGKLVLSYRGHTAKVFDLAWSPDARLIVSASLDKTAQVWTPFTPHTFVTYRGHTNAVHCVDWSPDSKYVVSGSSDETAQIWDAHTGKRTSLFRNESSVFAVLWSPDGRKIVQGTQKQGIEVWQSLTT